MGALTKTMSAASALSCSDLGLITQIYIFIDDRYLALRSRRVLLCAVIMTLRSRQAKSLAQSPGMHPRAGQPVHAALNKRPGVPTEGTSQKWRVPVVGGTVPLAIITLGTYLLAVFNN